MKKIFLFIFCCFATLTFGQNLEKKWNFTSIENINGEKTTVTTNGDYFNFNKGSFNYHISSIDSTVHTGNYIHQNNLLIANFSDIENKVSYYNIIELTDSKLTLSEKNIIYKLSSDIKPNITPVTPEVVTKENQIIKSKGITINSLSRGILGMFCLLVIAFLFSSNRKAIDWKTVGLGITFQLIIAISILKGKDIGFNIGSYRFDLGFISSVFDFIGKGFVKILDFTQAGSEFLFSGLVGDMDSFGYIFAFQVLPTIIFFSALTSLLFYLGLIQKIVKTLAWSLNKILKISGAESLSVAGNIFLGQTEAPLLIKAYLEKMNRSEILLVMIGGMATVAGAVLAAYIGFLGGNDEALRLEFAKHLLAASVMAAPGAIIISKILYPQTEEVNTDVHVSSEKIGLNILDAIANGTTEGLQLAMNVGAMLLVFVAFISMINGILGGLGGFDGISFLNWKFTSLNEIIASKTVYKEFSLEFILGYVFAPLMWLIGVAKDDMALMGQLLGIKLAASEFVGYIQLAELKNVASATHLTYNKSIIMATYMLCGFANFASIGIQIGGIGSLAPGQRKTLSEFGIKALIGGTIASLMSATIAGMIIG